MKFRFLKTAFAGLVLAASGFANATIITHNGYTLDSNTNIVSDGDIEYLQWNMTVGQSIDEALQQYSVLGWSLVTTVQMSNLFKDFGWSASTDETIGGSTIGTYTADTDNDMYDIFLELFGMTQSAGEESIFGAGVDSLQMATVTYGSNTNGNGWYNRVQVASDRVMLGQELGGIVAIQPATDIATNEKKSLISGVALIRYIDVVTVTEPSTLAIFALGLMGLASRRFKKH